MSNSWRFIQSDWHNIMEDFRQKVRDTENYDRIEYSRWRSLMSAVYINIAYDEAQKEYLNDNNIGMTELMRDITEYNSNLTEAQHGLQNPWVNWFYADYVNELTPIVLDNSD